MNPGPKGIKYVFSIADFPWARDLDTVLIQPREEHLQYSVSLPNTEEKLKLVECVATMRVTLLL
jgi:hypothetical protein